MNNRSALPLTAVVAGAILLAGCASAPLPSGTSDPSGAEETEARQPRLLVPDAETGAVLVLDATHLEPIAELALDGPGTLHPFGDTRYVLSAQTDGDRVQLIDAGTWSEDHGEHAHHFVAPPSVGEGALEGPAPVHVTTSGGLAGVYTDGDGALHVVDGSTLGRGLSATTVETGDPHHGVGYPLGEGAAILSFSNAEGRATGVRVVGSDGSVLAESADCLGLHGETELRSGFVFACEDGLLAVSDTAGWTFEKVPYGADGRTGTLVTNDDAEAAYGILGGSTLVSYDGTALSKAPLAGVGIALQVAADGDAIVAFADGTVSRVSPAGEVRASALLIGAFDPQAGHSAPRPALALGDGTVYVSDPWNGTVLALEAESLTVIGRLDLGYTPKGVALIG